MTRCLCLAFPAGVALAVLAGVFSPARGDLHPSFSHKAAADTVPFYTGADYDPAVPHPDEFLEYPLGQWPLRYNELIAFLQALAEASDRVILEEHGRSHEGRALYNLFISDSDNLNRRDDLRAGLALLAEPENIRSSAQRDSLVAALPAVAWLGYSIHGDELSGTDAAVALAYHLAAARDEATRHLLANLLIIIDPIENPDGRERYMAMLEANRSHVPNYDNQALQRGGVWPWGRTNHYLFDLNRDWILLTQPETYGRIRTILDWQPQLVVDAHEMGSYATFLFSPPREPVNYNIPDRVMQWYEVYNRDQAAACDQRGWPYYSGEWNDQWYPGYGSAWPTFFGAVGILYEQAGVSGLGIKQPGEYFLTFHESVNHQFTSSLANLTTTADNRQALLRDYSDMRREIIETGRRSGLQFLFIPDDDHFKMKRFIESIISQGIRVQRATGDFTVPVCMDPLRIEHKSKTFPAGTYIVSTAQPMGALAKAVLEFDLHLNLEFLKEERRELEKKNNTRMYEISSWSLPLAYDVDAYYTTSKFGVDTEPVTSVADAGGRLVNPEAPYGFIIDMQGEKTYRILGKLFAEELVIYCAVKPFTLEGHSFKAGSLFLRRLGNPADLAGTLDSLATEVGIDIIGVNSGRSTEGSFLGAPTFRLLVQPRIALITGSPMDYNSAGTLWFTVDQELQVPHSLILAAELARTDLSRYNVLVIPSVWGEAMSSVITAAVAKKLEQWIEGGGTLICTGQSAAWAADSTTQLSQVRLKRQSLALLDQYRLALERENRAEAPPVDTMALWYPEKAAEPEKEPEKTAPPDLRQLEDQDAWQKKFYPRGAILRANLDREDWLAFGMQAHVPVMVYGTQALLAMPPVNTTARFAAEDDLRISGLLWPEARARWASTAYATHEAKGQGQIVLFAFDPNLRAYFYGTRKMFVNALLYGPGMAGGHEEYKR